jgi:hypothetical protein
VNESERRWLSEAGEDGRLPAPAEQTLLSSGDVAAEVNPLVVQSCVRHGWTI